MLLLLPSATYRAPDFLDAARALDVDVVVGSDEEQPLGDVMGAHALQLPLADPDAAAQILVEHDRRLPLDAIVAVDDQGTVAAAAASERLGLRHNPPRAVAAARDKLLMRELLAKAEVQQPTFAAIPGAAPAADIAAVVEKVGLPCVIKPTTLSASQGVLRADSTDEVLRTARRVRAIATGAGVASGAPLLVERFVGGPEVALEGLLRDGHLEVLAVFDKPDPLEGPAFEESIYVTPSRLAARDARAVRDTAQQATTALGLTEGPVHAELRVSDGRAAVIEIASRTIGGLCSRALSFSTGRTLEQIVLAHALGMQVGAVGRPERASGVLMLPIPRAGTFTGVLGIPRALAVPGITDVEVTIPPGRPVRPAPEGNRYLGFAFARARRPKDVEHALRRAGSLLEVEVTPDGG